MTDRLSLYNGALREIGGRRLASLTEEQESRRALDEAWVGAVDRCLADGQWRWATRTAQLAPDPDTNPEFGYRLAYLKPTDFVRTTGLYVDEYCNEPLLQYKPEQDYWFTDAEPIYLSYVSNDGAYGGDLSRWPPEFVELVEAYLASRAVRRLTNERTEWERLLQLHKLRLRDAAARDAMEGPTTFPPAGRWLRARLGGSTGRLDRGLRGRLIG